MDVMRNPVRRYAWGSHTQIAELLGVPPDGNPQAELWLGAHASAPSRITRDGRSLGLDVVVAADPERELGAAVAAAFGDRLPYLLKVLAVAAPLSLQAHPSSAQAEAGHAAEERRGVPLDAAERNYPDPHHKPELVVALTRFEALVGFRPVEQTLDLLADLSCSGLAWLDEALRARSDGVGVREALTRLLTLPEPLRGPLVGEIAAACTRRLAAGTPYAADLATVGRLAAAYPGDVGVAAALLLDPVVLEPGEALHIPAGVLHAYQRGMAIEVMPSSDNVLRGGLTSKHVDVPELLRALDAATFGPARVQPQPGVDGEVYYPNPIAEFALSRIDLDGGEVGEVVVTSTGPQILLTTKGSLRVRTRLGDLPLRRGGSLYLPAADGPATLTGAGEVWRVRTGLER